MQWKRILLLATWMVVDNWPPSGHAEERATGYIFLQPSRPDYGPLDPAYREPSGPQVIIVPDHNDGTTRSYIVVPAREPDYGPKYEPEPTPEDPE